MSRFRDILPSVMNGVRVRRKAWPDEDSVEFVSYKCDKFGTKPIRYTFTTDDDAATDWEIVVPRPEPKK